jgi:DHA3 family tetracycline resistance protein-like MFS transporter
MEAAVFLFEVPTGVVADTYSRRLSLVIGYLGMGVAWAAVGLVSAPWLIIALWASGASLHLHERRRAGMDHRRGRRRRTSARLPARRALGQAGAVRRAALAGRVGTRLAARGVILGGVFTIACGLGCLVHARDGFRRRRARSAPRRSPSCGHRRPRARATPGRSRSILLLIGVELFMGARARRSTG